MIRPRYTLCALLAAALAPAIAAPASARPVSAKPPVELKIGHVALGTPAAGLASILVPVRYPIQLAGRLPERRRGFTFVHRVGIDISPVYPSRFSCSRLGFKVDGQSVQSTPTQDELELLHPLSFRDGPAGGGPPWVIGGDTGIHPSAAGYAQMASQVPPPG